MPEFMPGLTLNRLFYTEAVRPLLARSYPGLAYAAARIGSGSDVLGYDTAMSTDHDWGPRLILALSPADHERLAGQLRETLERELPESIRGYPVRFASSNGSHPAAHWVFVTTVAAEVAGTLGFDLDQPLTAADWLSFPMQRLLELTAGEVYHDGSGELTAVRKRFAYYPRDVWLYLLAAGWQRISQDDHLMPRAGIVGDELGASLIGARLIRDVMLLGFLMERRYAPYAKWLGTAFARLDCAPALTPLLQQARAAVTWRERSEALAAAGEELARRHNALAITPPLPVAATPFHERPFRVIQGERFVVALREQVREPAVQALFGRRIIGGIDQLSDNTDLLVDVRLRPVIRALFDDDALRSRSIEQRVRPDGAWDDV